MIKKEIIFVIFTIQGAKVLLFFDICKLFCKKIFFCYSVLHIWDLFCIFALDLVTSYFRYQNAIYYGHFKSNDCAREG